VSQPRGRTARDVGAALGSGLAMAIALPVMLPALSAEELFAGGWSEPLALFALVPLLDRVRQAPPRRAFGLAYLAGLAYFGLALFWLTHVMTTFGRLPMVAAVPILLLLVAFLALFWACPVWLALRLERERGWRMAWTLPLLWVGFELARAHVLTGFPWAHLGYTQVRSLWLLQLAALGGVHLVAWVVVFSNAVLAAAWAWLRGRGARPLAWLAAWALVLLLSGLWAALRLLGAPAPADAPRLQVAIVQGNLDEKAHLRGPAAMRWVLGRLLAESRAAVERGARLVVWPEGSLPEALPAEGAGLGPAAGHPAPLAAELVVGAVGLGRVGGEPAQWNSAFLLDGELRARARYDKQHLVPFGEYVPLGAVLPWEWFVPPGVRFFTPGVAQGPLPAQAGPLGVLVCYEAIFPELARAQVGQGARLLVNITNDSWFGRTSAPWQHLAMSRVRAVETGRYLLRAANTGVSAVIDPRGRVLVELGLGLVPTAADRVRAVELEPPARLLHEVALLDGLTPHAWLGELPARAAAAFAAVAWVLCWLRARRARRAPEGGPLSA